MSPGGAARRLLDPWAGLLLAALVALVVVILLATPGPWRLLGGADAPVNLDPKTPSDVAVFVCAGPAGARCTAVVWAHVDFERAAVTATLIPAETRCPVKGGGYAPVRRLVTDLGPGEATGALGAALGVDFRGWVAIDQAALSRLVSAAAAPGPRREARAAFKAAMKAFATSAVGIDALSRQRDALRRVLRGLPYGDFKANAVVNYVLGSEDVDAGLDLDGATKLVEAIHGMDGRDVAVGVAAAVVETCGPVVSWRVDRSRLEPLRQSLAFGIKAPSVAPRLTVSPRAAEVLVVTPVSVDGAVFAADLERALDDAGALPVKVRAVAVGAETVAAETAALVRRRRPLAVVLVVRDADRDDDATVAAALQQTVAALGVSDQPCVIADLAVGDELAEAAVATGAPVVAVDAAGGPTPGTTPSGWLFAAGEARRRAARLTAAAAARACWPGYLAPALPGTRLGFSYAARRALDVALAGPALDKPRARLAACGYHATTAPADLHAPQAPAVVFRPGSRRAALAVAGDLGWGAATVARDAAAPAAVTVVWPAE